MEKVSDGQTGGAPNVMEPLVKASGKGASLGSVGGTESSVSVSAFSVKVLPPLLALQVAQKGQQEGQEAQPGQQKAQTPLLQPKDLEKKTTPLEGLIDR